MSEIDLENNINYWLYCGMKDLIAAILYSENKTTVFNDLLSYQVIFLQQALEKFLKSLLMKLEPEKSGKLKAYSHNLLKVIRDITIYLNSEQKEVMYAGFSKVGQIFYDGFGSCKNRLALEEIELELKKYFDVMIIREYGKSLIYFALFIRCLTSGFLEIRYPHEVLLEDKLFVNFSEDEVRPIIFMNRDIAIATFNTSQIVLSFFGGKIKTLISSYFNWEEIKSYYDNPEDEQKHVYHFVYDKLTAYLLPKTDNSVLKDKV